MSKTSKTRRLTFYRNLTSYVLANEVDKFVSTRLGKADQADVQLLIANGEAFNQFDCDISQIEREKLYLALILSHISRFFHSHDPNHFSTFVRALYSQNSSRIVEKQLLDRFRTICLKKIAWLSDTSFFQDDDRRQRIIELIGDDLEEMDAFRNEEEEYTNDVMYDEICELIKSEERFKEQSLFFEISESLYEPYESLKQQTLLINHMNSIRNKRKLIESPQKVAQNDKTGDEKISTETASTDNKKPRLSVHKENIESSEKMSVGGDSDKENISLAQPEKTAIAKVGTKPRLSENRPIQNISNSNESEEFVDLDIAPSQHDAQEAVESTTAAATNTATEEAPLNEEKKEKENNLDKSKMVRLRKNLDLDQLANSNGESSDDNDDDLDFGETDSDKERQKRVNALKSKKVDSAKEKADENKSSTEDDVEKKPTSPKETRETRKKKGLYTLVSESDNESDDDKMELSHLRKVNLNKGNVAKGNKKPPASPKVETKAIRNTPTRKSAIRRSTPKKEKTSGSDVDSCSDSESSTSYRKASNTSIKKNESYKHRKTKKQRRHWTDEETIFLFVGIQLCGMGHWSDILKKFPDKFNDRIGPDLKDRYRNVTKDAHYLARFEEEANRMIKTRSLAK